MSKQAEANDPITVEVTEGHINGCSPDSMTY